MHSTKEWIGTNGGNYPRLEDSKGSITDVLLEIRGIKSKEAKKDFLNPLDITLMHPNAFCDMQKAVERISKAINDKEKILIYGDFDADGVTSTSVLVKTIQHLEGNVDYYIPDRDAEGHGLNTKALVKILSQKKPKLIITVDNGISSVEEVKFINSFSRDVIITDHHEAPEELPPAYAIINPKAMNSLSDKLTPIQIEYLTSLAGVGVAFKLAQGILEKFDKISFSYDLLPFVTVGTIADLVPLIGENRYFVKKGLELISQGKHYGLKRLLETSGINIDNGLTSEQVAFTIAPRINASGRIESVDPAIKLLISDNKQEIELSIMQLDNLNKIRQQMVNDAFEEADAIWKNTKSCDNAIIIASPNWHIGIIGIVASKFVEKYYKPTFIMTFSEETNTYRCSARGVKELNLYDIISTLSDKFDGFGGHQLAGGFTFSADKISFEEVKKSLNSIITEMLDGIKLKPSLNIDMELSLNDIDISLIESISQLEPFGMSNPSPTFVVKNITLKEKKLMGSTKEHLKLIVEGPSGNIDCVWWSRGDIPLISGDKIDIAFAPQLNVYNGNTTIQLVVKDVHSEGLNQSNDENNIKIYDHRKKINILAQVDNYIKNSDKKIAIFVENRLIRESLKPYCNICNCLVNRLTIEKSDVLMFFDYPADEDIFQQIMKISSADTIHYMNYSAPKNYEETLLKTFSGMIRYTCNNLNGAFAISRAASALGITDIAVEVLLEMFEDLKMIKIKSRNESHFELDFINSVELSKIYGISKYAEFVELMNNMSDYKNHFMNTDLP